MDKAEIIIYKDAQNTDFQIDVRVEDETVWLTQMQMAELFQTTRNNITLHIGNIFKEGELDQVSVCKDYLLTALDGKKYKTRFYNLDVIISIGYRVKSQRGTHFRIWANKILKDYLLRGYAINERVERIEKKILEHDQKFELIVNTGLKPSQGIFFTGNINKQLQTDLNKHNQQYPPIVLKHFAKSHDRFLIIDDKELYHIGASLKDLGKRWFAFSKINLNPDDIIRKLS